MGQAQRSCVSKCYACASFFLLTAVGIRLMKSFASTITTTTASQGTRSIVRDAIPVSPVASSTSGGDMIEDPPYGYPASNPAFGYRRSQSRPSGTRQGQDWSGSLVWHSPRLPGEPGPPVVSASICYVSIPASQQQQCSAFEHGVSQLSTYISIKRPCASRSVHLTPCPLPPVAHPRSHPPLHSHLAAESEGHERKNGYGAWL